MGKEIRLGWQDDSWDGVRRCWRIHIAHGTADDEFSAETLLSQRFVCLNVGLNNDSRQLVKRRIR